MQEGLKNIEELPEGSPENPVKTELVDPGIEENVAAPEEMRGDNLKNVETEAPVKEEKSKTPREIVLELKREISGIDQQTEEARGRYRNVLNGGIEARVAAGPGAQAEVAQLEAGKQVKLKELEEAKKQSRGRAFEVLSAPDVMKMSPRELVEFFGDLTENENGERRDLKKESSEMAYKNERERGMTVLVGKEAIEVYRQRATKREEDKIHAEERSSAIVTCWDRLSEKEKKQFKVADSPEFKNYLDQKRQKLGISENSFAGLVKMGYKPEAAKVRGWFGRLFGHAVEIPASHPDIFLSSDGSKDDINKWVEDNHNKSVKEYASKRVDLRIIEGRHRLLREKAFCTKQIVTQTVESYKPEEQRGQEVENYRVDEQIDSTIKNDERKKRAAKKRPPHFNKKDTFIDKGSVKKKGKKGRAAKKI